ncbi:unnamed protein product [Paramecium octaurelia]|uniref:Uncharacterized protein n=1 Tax=Paramecium octaurelia TaxID=43137 RepID=A0A8S1YMS1_PAROT|nr:unnamed protein product [Paramecium octaurelia]CAD8215220.1 unnamed protein product [Paramecium octaurelia]
MKQINIVMISFYCLCKNNQIQQNLETNSYELSKIEFNKALKYSEYLIIKFDINQQLFNLFKSSVNMMKLFNLIAYRD